MKLTKKISVLLVLALIVNGIAFINPTSASATQKVSLSKKKLTIMVGQFKKLKLKNNKKKVTWKIISGKKNISLKSKKKTGVTVVGKKNGTAKVQAKVGRKSYTCTVTVKAKETTQATKTPSPAVSAQPTGTPTATTSVEPAGTPTATASAKPTGTPGQGEALTLYYNDGNAEQVKKQIQDSEIPVHVIVEDSVTSIEAFAFLDCSSLTSITIPESVTWIGQKAFSSCSNLNTIKVSDKNICYDSREDCNAIIETTSDTLITGCKNTVIPESVTSIGFSAFYGCSSLTDIIIPESVTSIEYGAFLACGLMSITIPKSVTSIGERVFYSCSDLDTIKVSNENLYYDSRENCNAIIETTSDTLIAGCKNTIIPESVTSIGDDAFYDCSSLTNITIPESVTRIGFFAFYGCSNLTSITIPESVTSIGYHAFDNCDSLTSITIPESVTNIGNDAFAGIPHIYYSGTATGSPWGADAIN